MEKAFEKGTSFIKKIKKNEKVCIIHHTDVDGLASAALTFIALKRLGLKISKVVARSVDEIKKIFFDLKKCDKVIILDVPLENFDELEKASEKILIIDHHPSTAMVKKILCINPRVEKKDVYQPTSYLVYKFFSRLVDLKDREWLSVLGTLADFGFEDCKDLLRGWVRIRRKSEILRTKFWKVAKMVRALSLRLKEEEIVKTLVSSKTLEELEKNEKVLKAFEEYEKILKKSEKEFWRNAEKFERAGLIISRISEKVGSEIASEISAKFPDKMIILLEKCGKEYKVHARYQNARIHLGKLMEKVCGGGGHKQAAGGKIPAKELENFKEKLLRMLYV